MVVAQSLTYVIRINNNYLYDHDQHDVEVVKFAESAKKFKSKEEALTALWEMREFYGYQILNAEVLPIEIVRVMDT